MKLCFIILAHDRMDRLADLINLFRSQGCAVCLHLDKKVTPEEIDELKSQLELHQSALMFARRVRCSWGTYSLVDAVLKAVEKIDESNLVPDYVYLLSGADVPIKPIEDLKAFLKFNQGKEFIESFDDKKRAWIKDGVAKDRYRHHFIFNYQTQKRMFDISLKIQRWLGVDRSFPEGYSPHFGSQWWCLTWESLLAIQNLARQPQLKSFFKTVLVPDEMFFQTIIRKVVCREAILSHSLTYYRFDQKGKPLLIYRDQLNKLYRLPYFFARKLSECETGIYAELKQMQNDNRALDQKWLRTFMQNVYCYESHVHQNSIYRHGIHQRLVNVSHTANLKANNRTYFIVIGLNEDILTQFSDALNEHEGLVCHRRLYKAGEIQFENGSRRSEPYGKWDVQLRDYCPPNFLFDLIQQQPNATVGFCCTLDDYYRPIPGFKNWLGHAVAWDHNCKVLILTDGLAPCLDEDDERKYCSSRLHEHIIEAAYLSEISELKRQDRSNLLKLEAGLDSIYDRQNIRRALDFIKPCKTWPSGPGQSSIGSAF